jgi:hypothetical protein
MPRVPDGKPSPEIKAARLAKEAAAAAAATAKADPKKKKPAKRK